MNKQKQQLNTCDNCTHREGEECRRYPPTVSVVMIPQKSVMAAGMQLQPSPVSAFPVVQPHLWCGEWAGGFQLKAVQ